MLLALVPLGAVLSGGCGTLNNIQRPAFPPPESPNAPVCRAYGGVRGDWATMSEYQWSRTASYLDYAIIPLLAAGDLFFTGVGDTFTLPYTLVEEGRRAFSSPPASTGSGPASATQSTPQAPPAVTRAPSTPGITSPR
jgi:hypothetical protein